MTIEQQKVNDEEQEFVEVNNLSDISIDRLDLVGGPNGGGPAIGRTFFLLKSKQQNEEEPMLEKFQKDVDGVLLNLSKAGEDTIVEAKTLITDLKKSIEDEDVEIDKDKAQALVSDLEKALEGKDEVSTTLTELVAGLKELTKENKEESVDSEAEEALKASELSDEIKQQLLDSIKKQNDEVKKAEEARDEAYRLRIEKAELEAASAKDEIAKMVRTNRKAEWITKAQDYTHISGSAEDIGSLLMEIEEVSKEAAERVETLLKSAEAGLKESKLFKELGTSVQPDADSAVGKITAIAKARVEKDGGTMEQRLGEAWAENPELYAEYNKEFSGKVK